MKQIELMIVVLGMAVMMGCNAVPPYTEGRAEIYVPPQIQLVGPEREDLRRMTAIDEPIMSRDQYGILFVTVPVRATDNHILHTRYRVTFLDQGGQPMPGSPSAWFVADLEPGAMTPIKFNSTSPRATSFQMELRLAR